MNLLIDKAWFSDWWKKNWKFEFTMCVAITIFAGMLLFSYSDLPANYNAKNMGNFNGTCCNIESYSEEMRGVHGRYFLDYTVLYMSDGRTYYVDEDYYDFFDISSLKENLNNKVLTIQYELKERAFGHKLLLIQDQDKNEYLNVADIEQKHKSIRILVSIVFGGLTLLTMGLGWSSKSEIFDHIRDNIRRVKKKEQKKKKQLARQQRSLDNPDSFKNVKNKKEK